MTQPTTSTRTTIFLHDGVGATAPFTLQLHSNVLRLLRRFETVQARATGQLVIPTAEEDPLFAALENMPPADVELCLIGAVGLVCDLCLKAGDELMIVTAEEADGLRAERRRVGTGPLSELRKKGA